MVFFFFNDTATTEISTLSLHDALPICGCRGPVTNGPLGPRSPLGHVDAQIRQGEQACARLEHELREVDRKSTRLNSSHANISYAVFCLKKKKHHQLGHK